MWAAAWQAMAEITKDKCKCACQCQHMAEEMFYRSANTPPLPLCKECYEEWIEPSWWE